MAPTLTLLVIALLVSVQDTLAHYPPPNSPSSFDFLKNLNGTQKGDKVKGIGQLKKHLANLGYIDPTTTNPTINLIHDHTFDDTLHQAIQKYQDFFAIEPTGTLDSETVASMHQPRCGVADIRLNHNASFGDIKYILEGPKWPSDKRNLTVSFPNGTRVDAYDPVNIALIRWASVSPFRIKFISNVEASDVKMSFQKRDHGANGHTYDGPRGVLAHASAGPIDITNVFLHFDDEENWATTPFVPKRKIDLQTVALHELGHILGLDHSPDPNSIMYPAISFGKRKDLNSDDIQGINAMYPS